MERIMHPIWTAAALVGVVCLSACGAGTDFVAEAELARIDEADAMLTRIYGNPNITSDDMPGTAWNSMPDNGSADFEGYATILIDPVAPTNSDDIVVIGDAGLTAEFGSGGAVTGRVDNLFGIVGADAAAQGMTATGAIIIGNSDTQIGPGGARPGLLPNEWVADYTGTLGVGGSSYVLAGVLDGTFLGTAPGQGPDGVIRATEAVDVGVSGTAPYVIAIIAEN